MKSEMDLDQAISQLTILATDGALYRTFVDLGCVSSLMSLLLHENTDIALEVIELLVDLTTPSVFEEQPDAIVLLDDLVAKGGLEYLVENLKRLKVQVHEDGKGIYHTLHVLENISDVKPDCMTALVKQSDVVDYLVGLVALSQPPAREGDAAAIALAATAMSLKQYAAEVLAIIVQNSKLAQTQLFKRRRLETVLKILANYRKVDPRSVEEEEVVENLFNCLCSGLLEGRGQATFMELDGIELMLIFLRKRMFCKKSALKVLDFALLHEPASCQRFIEGMGLKALFGAFMKRENDDGKKKKKKRKKKYQENETEDEEHIVSCIVSLFHFATDTRRLRLQHKFVEDNFAKVERLVELHEKYAGLVAACNKKIEAVVAYRSASFEDYEAEEDAAEFDIMRLDAGLAVLQLVDIVIAYVVQEVSLGAKELLTEQLGMIDCSVVDIRNTLKEYLESYFLLADDDEEYKKVTRRRLKELLTRVEVECSGKE